RQVNEFELAIARIEANATDDPLAITYRGNELVGDVPIRAASAIQILPPKPTPPLYAGFKPVRRTENTRHAPQLEEFIQHVRATNKFIGIAVVGMAIIGAAIIAAIWPANNVSSRIEIANRLTPSAKSAADNNNPDNSAAAATEGSSKLPFPLPSSFGVYVLSDNKLTELEPLPINVPDARIALSAEISKPSIIKISDNKPAFILFRRDLLNNVPEKVMLRAIARMSRETKIVA